MNTVYPIGTTLYKPGQCCNGYTLISGAGGVGLIDMNGKQVHHWPAEPGRPRGFIHRARLLPDGKLMLLAGPRDGVEGHIEQWDWEGRLTWQYTPQGRPHHDFYPMPDGGAMLICESPVPREVVDTIKDPVRRALTILGDSIVHVSRKGEVLWQWRQYEHLDINLCNSVPANRQWAGGPDNNTITDWTHTNTVQPLPENRWFDEGDERFRPGNVLISMRQLNTILIIDRESGQVTWSYTGTYHGGMSGQHESEMIEKGLPGAGNILVFDNGSSPYNDLAHAGRSYVLEIDPPSGELVWHYEDGHRFFSPFTSNCQRLANGNTLILEAACSRLFEVTPEGKTVWEHITTENAQRVYRYSYDFCPQSAALPRPAERSVTPPKPFTIPPDEQ